MTTCVLCGLHRSESNGLCPHCGDPDHLTVRFERQRHIDRDFLASRVLRPASGLARGLAFALDPQAEMDALANSEQAKAWNQWAKETESAPYRGVTLPRESWLDRWLPVLLVGLVVIGAFGVGMWWATP